MTSVGLIPRKRLRWIHAKFRAPHEYCFFLHDECVRALKEYEAGKAHHVSFKFRKPSHVTAFEEAAKHDPFQTMRDLGYDRELRKMIVNQVTVALVSDCLHHLYEGLTCIERRKIVVAFNVLRKPLKDSLLQLSWMYGDEDEWYAAFTSGNPERLSAKRLGNIRKEILAKAVAKTRLGSGIRADVLNQVLFDRSTNDGFEPLFQRAVHLITVEYAEIRTEPENFNFVFKDYRDADVDEGIYRWLPYALFYLSHVIVGLFHRMHAMQKGALDAFYVRSANGFALTCDLNAEGLLARMQTTLGSHVACPNCKTALKVTRYNGLRIVLAESFRCTRCGKHVQFPLSWIFR